VTRAEANFLSTRIYNVDFQSDADYHADLHLFLCEALDKYHATHGETFDHISLTVTAQTVVESVN
jgi:hypothetical protein